MTGGDRRGAQKARRKIVGQGTRHDGGDNGAARCAGGHLERNVEVCGLRLCLFGLEAVQRLDQEVDGAGGVGAGRDRSAQNQREFVPAGRRLLGGPTQLLFAFLRGRKGGQPLHIGIH